MQSFANRLRLLRGPRNQEDFADMVGITARSVINYERGERLPRIDIVSLICSRMKCSADWLILGHGEAPASIKTGDAAGSVPQLPENTSSKNKKSATSPVLPISSSPSEGGQEITLLVSHMRELSALLVESGREVQRLTQENADLRIKYAELKASLPNEQGTRGKSSVRVGSVPSAHGVRQARTSDSDGDIPAIPDSSQSLPPRQK